MIKVILKWEKNKLCKEEQMEAGEAQDVKDV